MEKKGEHGNIEQRLTSDIISDATLYALTLHIHDSGVDVRISSRLNDRTVVDKRLDFGPRAASLQAFEEMVYDNSLLTADFHKVEIIVDTNRFFVMSADDCTDDEVERRINLLWPYDRLGIELLPVVNEIERGKTCLVWAIDRPLKGFLQRTWNNPAISHRLAVATRYFALNSPHGGTGTVHLHITGDRLDVAAFNRDGLVLLNSYVTHSPADGAYYALAALQHIEFDNDTDRVMVDGDTNQRNGLIESLRPYVKTVIPETGAVRR